MDDWLQEKSENEALWYAELSDGQVVIQDDARPGLDPSSAWLRLKHYCIETGLTIHKVWVKFRSNALCDFMPVDADGYFFIRNEAAVMNVGSFSFYVFGYLEGEVVRTVKIKVPELIIVENSTRSIDKCGPGLIYNVVTYQG